MAGVLCVATRVFSFAAIDTSVIEIDAFNGSPFARKVNDVGAGSFCELMANFRAEGLIVGEGHDHVRNHNRRIFDSKLNLFKPAFASDHIDLIVVIPKIYLTLTQDLPPAWRLCCASQGR